MPPSTSIDAPPGADQASPDVVVVGNGVIGLCAALALADRGARVCLIGETLPGDASSASAGMLGALLGDTFGSTVSPPVREFAIAARDRYVGFLTDLTDRSGIEVPLNRLGIIEMPGTGDDIQAARRAFPERWRDPADLARLEPSLAAPEGALLLDADGSVDNLALLEALRTAIECTSRVTTIEESVERVERGSGTLTCTTATGTRCEAPHVVMAAGAWTSRIAGLPRHVPVEPVRGQMFAVANNQGTGRLRRVVYGHHVYLVPRRDAVMVGATMEAVGFDASTTPDAIASLRAAASVIWPAMESAPWMSSWAGLRPVTPDLLPLIGVDPDWPELTYACGHSRNGMLMAPLTGDCVAALVRGETPPADLAPFRPERFANAGKDPRTIVPAGSSASEGS